MARGLGKGVALLLSGRPGEPLGDEHPISRIFERERTTRDDFELSDVLVQLDASMANIQPRREELGTWLLSLLEKAWATNHAEASGALAELEAFGALSRVFADCVPVPRSPGPTPDFQVPKHLFVEVYCPRESDETRAVPRELENQSKGVKIVVSHPLTGSGGQSLRYAANQVVTRFLNTKRSSGQFRVGEPCIIYVNARHEWGLLARDLLPMRSFLSGDVEGLGTLGAWHAFYGEKGLTTMLSGPAALAFPLSVHAYEQRLEGLFRAEPNWSGALVAVRDGVALFENPWAVCPLAEPTLRALMRLYRFRPEFSWYRADGTARDLEMDVERALARLRWTFAAPPQIQM